MIAKRKGDTVGWRLKEAWSKGASRLSPLPSNVVLDEFDQELERRGLRFARYADDSNIYAAVELESG